MSEFLQLIDPDELIRQIESYGFRMFVGEDGIVHGKPVKAGTSVPWEMRPLLDQLPYQNDAVAAILAKRQNTIDLKNLTYGQAQPWLEKVKAGEYRLIGRVTYNRRTNTSSFVLERIASGE